MQHCEEQAHVGGYTNHVFKPGLAIELRHAIIVLNPFEKLSACGDINNMISRRE